MVGDVSKTVVRVTSLRSSSVSTEALSSDAVSDAERFGVAEAVGEPTYARSPDLIVSISYKGLRMHDIWPT
jgi:hypothetical protein